MDEFTDNNYAKLVERGIKMQSDKKIEKSKEWKFVAKIEKQKTSTYDGTLELKALIQAEVEKVTEEKIKKTEICLKDIYETIDIVMISTPCKVNLYKKIERKVIEAYEQGSKDTITHIDGIIIHANSTQEAIDEITKYFTSKCLKNKEKK